MVACSWPRSFATLCSFRQSPISRDLLCNAKNDLNGYRSRGPERKLDKASRSLKRLSSGQPGHRQSEVHKDETFSLIRLTPQNITPVQHRSYCSMDNRAARRRDLIGSSGQSLPCSDPLDSVVSWSPFTPPSILAGQMKQVCYSLLTDLRPNNNHEFMVPVEPLCLTT